MRRGEQLLKLRSGTGDVPNEFRMHFDPGLLCGPNREASRFSISIVGNDAVSGNTAKILFRIHRFIVRTRSSAGYDLDPRKQRRPKQQQQTSVIVTIILCSFTAQSEGRQSVSRVRVIAHDVAGNSVDVATGFDRFFFFFFG